MHKKLGDFTHKLALKFFERKMIAVLTRSTNFPVELDPPRSPEDVVQNNDQSKIFVFVLHHI